EKMSLECHNVRTPTGRDAALRPSPPARSGRNELSRDSIQPDQGAAERGADSAARCPYHAIRVPGRGIIFRRSSARTGGAFAWRPCAELETPARCSLSSRERVRVRGIGLWSKLGLRTP